MSRYKHPALKQRLAKRRNQTKWAPFWTVIKKYGVGKRVHPSEITATRRHWSKTKLRIKPRKTQKSHLG